VGKAVLLIIDGTWKNKKFPFLTSILLLKVTYKRKVFFLSPIYIIVLKLYKCIDRW